MAMVSSACSLAAVSAEEAYAPNVQKDLEDSSFVGESISISQGDQWEQEALNGMPDTGTNESVSGSNFGGQRNRSEQTLFYVDAAEAPIILDSYGEGEKPLIAGNGKMIKGTDNDYFKDTAVVLHNQDYWEINNLEITNIGTEASTGPDADVSLVQDICRMGVVISTRSPGD